MCQPTDSKDVHADGTKRAGEVIARHQKTLGRGFLIGAVSVFISMFGAAMTFPFLQAQRDNLGCDALCFGTMQSARSGLSLIGAFVVGRLSDKVGRINCLWVGLCASLISYILNWRGASIFEMWLSLIPSSLLNQNFGVLKALFADYNSERGGTESDRVAAMGYLGMVIGLAIMLGPICGATLLKNYTQATAIAFFLTLLSGSLLFFLPTPKPRTMPVKDIMTSSSCKAFPISKPSAITSFFSMPAASTKGAKLLFFIRLTMALAFSIFISPYTVSLRARFSFGPKDHAYFMGWIGLWYALSQGVLAKYFIGLTGEDPTPVLLVCMVFLGIGRAIAFLTSSLTTVYIIMAFSVTSLGVVNTAISSACSRLAGPDQVGGLFGILETLENAAGLVGPTIGGLLNKFGSTAVISVVVGLYSFVFFAVMIFYKDTIVKHCNQTPTPTLRVSDDVVLQGTTLSTKEKTL